uniref:Uncharacterized protein n=1 Tax=Plectus sambesii TaxID=2011161 RepID=A0A914UKN2_9BILA
MDKFINRTLRTDGITVLRLVSDNCGDIVTAELVLYLWKKRNDHRGTSVQGASENAFQEVSAAALDPNGAAIDGSNNQGTQTNFFGELESVLDGRNARVRSRTTTATN